MSTDLKIELFGEDLFKYLYEHHGIREKPSKGKKHPPRKSEFTEKIFRAVQVRMAMCHYTYEGIIENTHWEFSGNWSDFFDTIVFQFPHYVDWKRNPSPEMAMSVFLYSCAFVADMVLWSRMKGDNFLYVGPKAWAMFVDLYMKKEFYARGGWKKLHKFVEHDTVVHDYMKTFSEEVDCVLGKAFMFHTPFLTCGAVDSFDEFEASLEGVDDDAPMALKWVDYCVKVPFMKIRDSKFYYPSDSDVFLKLEVAMLDLGYILNPDREGDYFEGDSDAAGSPKTKADVRRKSQTTRIQSKCRKETTSDFPIAPVGRFDTEPPTQGIDDDYYSDGENLRRRVDLYLKTVELDNTAKSPLTSPNINVLSTPRKSPLTSPNVTVLSTPDGYLYKRINASDLSGSSRKSPARKENSPSSISKAEMKKKSPRQKNFKVYSISPNSSKGTDVQELKIIQEGKYPVIDSFCPSQLYLDYDDPSKDEKKSLLDETEIPLDCGKPLKTENEMTTAETTHQNPIGIDGKKAKKKKSNNELNFDDSNKEASQTSQSENTTAEPVLENPLGLSAEPQDAGKKVKKKKKRISRLEQRVKEEGDCVHDVTRLILVMGHQPGMESVASAFHNSKKQTPKDDNQN